MKENTRKFWSYVNGLKGKTSIPPNTFLSSRSAQSYTEGVNLFSYYFQSFYSDDVLASLDRSDVIQECISTFDLSIVSLRRIVTRLEDNINAGPDGIPPMFVKRCWAALEGPVVRIFSRIFETGIFPKMWKFSYIFPILKEGDSHNITNYRPISVLSCLPKLLDALLAESLSNVLFGRLAQQQHGFIKGRSTLTNLLVFTDFVSEELSKSHQVDALYTDMSKAFDRVNRERLTTKLWNIGIRGKVFKLLESYLCDRTQAVRYNNCVSDKISVPSGVPQGSHLGPILFCVYINDLIPTLNIAKILLYADDVKIFMRVETEAEARALQLELDVLVGWAADNGLSLNAQKCSIMSYVNFKNPLIFEYYIGSVRIPRNYIVRDLGVYMDSRLSFAPHQGIIISKCCRVLGFLKRSCRDFKNISAMIYLYRTLVLPYIYYCSPIWRPHAKGLVYNLEKMQHKFFRFLAYKMGRPIDIECHDYTGFAGDVEMPSVKSIQSTSDLIVTYKIFNELIRCAELRESFVTRELPYSLRYFDRLLVETCQRNVGFHSSLNRLKRLWNGLPSNIIELDTVGDFKEAVSSLFLEY